MRAIKQRHSITIKSSQFLDCLIATTSIIRLYDSNGGRSREQTERWRGGVRPKVWCKKSIQTRKFIYLEVSTLCIEIACDTPPPQREDKSAEAQQAERIPYTRKKAVNFLTAFLVVDRGFEPLCPAWEAGILALRWIHHCWLRVQR